MPCATDSGGGGRPGAATAFFDLDRTRISRSGPLAFAPSFHRHDLINRVRAARGLLNERKAARIGRLAAEQGTRADCFEPCSPGLASTVGQHSWPAQGPGAGLRLTPARHVNTRFNKDHELITARASQAGGSVVEMS